jgi:hypothetical protein
MPRSGPSRWNRRCRWWTSGAGCSSGRSPRRAATSGSATTYRSVAPAAVAAGLVTESQRDAWLSDVERATVEHGDHTATWPLLIGAYRQRTGH